MCDTCNYQQYLDKCEKIIEAKENVTIIEDIYIWVEEHKHITDKQRATIQKFYK